MYTIMFSANKGSFISFFFPILYAFYIFSLPIAVTGTSSVLLSRSGEMDMLALFPIWREKHAVFHY